MLDAISVEAFEWMKKKGYEKKGRLQRMRLFHEAMYLFPEPDEEPWEDEGLFPWRRAGMDVSDFF